MSIDLKSLRQQLKTKRKQVDKFQQQSSSSQILHRLRHFPQLQQAKRVGIYLHPFGEIQTQQMIEYCFAQHKQVYLPMICSMNQQLQWVKISKQQYRNKRFSHHPLGMQEPMASRAMHVSKLDVLIMPLLACDVYGTRIGMGGGFYDKTLASAPNKPLRLGIAHDFQLVQEQLPRQVWDQPLDVLITPLHMRLFKR